MDLKVFQLQILIGENYTNGFYKPSLCLCRPKINSKIPNNQKKVLPLWITVI